MPETRTVLIGHGWLVITAPGPAVGTSHADVAFACAIFAKTVGDKRSVDTVTAP